MLKFPVNLLCLLTPQCAMLTHLRSWTVYTLTHIYCWYLEVAGDSNFEAEYTVYKFYTQSSVKLAMLFLCTSTQGKNSCSSSNMFWIPFLSDPPYLHILHILSSGHYGQKKDLEAICITPVPLSRPRSSSVQHLSIMELPWLLKLLF